ncbi:MAG: hypothetical protein ACI9DC_003987 [Gammaproteobacteria bacterium]|jgi:hypothetical protein
MDTRDLWELCFAGEWIRVETAAGLMALTLRLSEGSGNRSEAVLKSARLPGQVLALGDVREA